MLGNGGAIIYESKDVVKYISITKRIVHRFCKIVRLPYEVTLKSDTLGQLKATEKSGNSGALSVPVYLDLL